MIHETTDPSETATLRQLRTLLDDCAIEIVYQPIFDLRAGSILGYEALTRPGRGSGFAHAGELFDTARQCGMTAEIEQLARRVALRDFRPENDAARLFLNNSPHVLADDHFLDELHDELAARPELDPSRIVLELTEHAQFDLVGQLAGQTFRLREHGFQIAIDDVGAGTSGLNRILTLRPNWLKLDREMITAIDEDPFKQNLVRFLVRFGKLSNMTVIAEGIERTEELRMLIDLGVDCAQGYYLACPGRLTQLIDPALQRNIIQWARQAETMQFSDPGTVTIRDFAAAASVATTDQTVADALDQLATASDDTGIVVRDDHNQTLHWAAASTLRAHQNAGRGDRPVSEIATSDISTIRSDATLADAMRQVAIAPEHQLLHPIILVNVDEICGIVSIRQLLAAAASEHRRYAPHVATLSGLPDRAQADHWLAEQIRLQQPMYVSLIDLVGLDAYNAAYGYEMGDAMLRRLAAAMRSIFCREDSEAPMIAHLRDDHFLLATFNDPRPGLQQLNDAFLEARREFFSPVDLAAEAFCDVGDAPHPQAHELTALRMIVAVDPLQNVDSPRELHAMMRLARDASEATHWPGGCRLCVIPPAASSRRASA